MGHWLRVLIGAGCLLAVTACGPLTIPIVERLPEAQQKTIDAAWDNLLSPLDRLDRQGLLDTLIAYQLHQQGVDTLRLHAEKGCARGTVCLDVYHDRAHPERDRFVVEVYDRAWNLERRESYTSEEVLQAVHDLSGRPGIITTDAEGHPTPAAAAEAERRQQDRKRRLERVRAATQPAVGR